MPQLFPQLKPWIIIPSLILIILLGLSQINRVGLSIWLINRLATNTNPVAQNLSYSDASASKTNLDIYAPSNMDSETQHPVIVFYYGGCWGACIRFFKQDYRFVAESLTQQGYIVVIPDYRIHPDVKFPVLMDDATSAVEWVTTNIEQYGGDPDQLILMGHSAGAQMASLLTLNKTYLRPETHQRIRGFIGLAGPYDFLPFDQAYQPILFGPEDKYPDSQAINFVEGNEPPLLLLYGNADTVVFPQNIENLSQKVKALGGEVEVHRYDGIDHAGLMGTLSVPLRDRQPVYNHILNFLASHTSKNSQPAP